MSFTIYDCESVCRNSALDTNKWLDEQIEEDVATDCVEKQKISHPALCSEREVERLFKQIQVYGLNWDAISVNLQDEKSPNMCQAIYYEVTDKYVWDYSKRYHLVGMVNILGLSKWKEISESFLYKVRPDQCEIEYKRIVKYSKIY